MVGLCGQLISNFPWNHVITITAILQLYYPPILLPVELFLNCIVHNLKVHVLIGSFISNPISTSFTVSLVKTNYKLYFIHPPLSTLVRIKIEASSLRGVAYVTS